MRNRYKVIALCGSSRFKKEFFRERTRLNLAGNIVLSKNVFPHVDKVGLSLSDEIMLIDIEKHMINMADEVFVINKDNYIDEVTQNEIDYAVICGKPITYMEERF